MVLIGYLLVAFLMFRKVDRRLNLLYGIVYSVGLLFCYNTLVVCLFGLLHIGGSLFAYSIVHFVVGSILWFVSFKRKSVQQYELSRRIFFVFVAVLVIAVLIGYVRFDGLSTISYESGDSSIHYRHALSFSKELSRLDKVNSKDIVYGDFDKVMPISYVNGGFFLAIFSNFPSYKAFLLYDSFCYVLGCLLFLVTVLRVYSDRKRNCFYAFVITLGYMLGFSLNSFLFGFCYLGLGIMVINLLFLTILDFYDTYSVDRVFQLVVLFLLNFSVFFSYYLFVPAIYLALGIYYLSLWHGKRLDIKELFLYGGVTLVIPFIIGFVHFMAPSFLGESSSVFGAVTLDGDIYNNITPIYVFVLVVGYLIYDRVKRKRKLDYFYLNLYVLAGYIFVFLVLYILGYSQLYYFYKLFYLYWFFEVLLFGRIFLERRGYVYGLGSVILLGILYVLWFPYTQITNILIRTNVYFWNARCFASDRVIFSKGDLELVMESRDYSDICVMDHEFLIVGDKRKNFWFYSITGNVPVVKYGDWWNLADDTSTLGFWEESKSHRCVVYFYDNVISYYDEVWYEVLYENSSGVILRKRFRNGMG